MIELELDRPSSAHPRRSNTALLVMILLAVVGWILAGVSGAFGDYRKLGERVTTLETQRAEDTKRLDRIENKIDQLLERAK